MTVRIVTDSTSDLSPELISEFGITVVPAYVRFGDRTYKDGIDISQDELYHKMVTENIPAATSQPPPSDFVDIYKKMLKQADNILSIHVTSKLSGIYNSAIQARDMISGGKRIRVVDSLSVSMGMGLMALSAARLAKAGEELPEIMEDIKTSISSVHLWGVVDTLKYLFLGGRIGKAKALLGGVLHVKPLLTMIDGELHPSGLARTRSKGMDKLVDNLRGRPDIQEIAIVHSTTPEDALTLKERISTFLGNSPIHISRLGPALGVHGGPGALIVAIRES